MRAQIIKSQIELRGVVIEWSDGVEFVYDSNLKLTAAGSYDPARQAVSATSARETLNGCGVQKVSR
jgi:hypothetical protein